MKTRAAIVAGPGEPFTIEEISLPRLSAGEILVKIAAVGICHTDLASRSGLPPAPFPSVFGHEGAGIVEEVGKGVTTLARGDHVVLSPDSCGRCAMCRRSEPMYCRDFITLNFQASKHCRMAKRANGQPVFLGYFGQSTFADYAIAGARNTVKVRKDVPLKFLGPLGCSVQTGAGTVMLGLKAPPGSSIAIVGTGSVGLSALMGAAVCGCTTIIAIDRIQSRLKMAQELGATHTFRATPKGNIGKAIRRIAPEGVRFIVDTTGSRAAITSALDSLAPRGTLALVGVPSTPRETLELDLLTIMQSGQVVRGFVEGHCVPADFIPRLVNLYATGDLPLEKLISFYPLAQVNKAVRDQLSGKVLKAVLVGRP